MSDLPRALVEFQLLLSCPREVDTEGHLQVGGAEPTVRAGEERPGQGFLQTFPAVLWSGIASLCPGQHRAPRGPWRDENRLVLNAALRIERKCVLWLRPSHLHLKEYFKKYVNLLLKTTIGITCE